MVPHAMGPSRFDGHAFPQVIPEPDHVISGGPAPWAELAPSDRPGTSLVEVMERLRSGRRLFSEMPIPGDPAELIVVADARRQPITHRSAVLVALFEEGGETHLVLTRRAFSLRHHRGEIALPGGRSEEDEAPIDTALREAREEVGLDPSSVEPVGWLSPIVSFASGSAIWPVVGLLATRPELIADPSEVDRAFTVSLEELLLDGAFVEERWRRGQPRPGSDADGYFPIYFYRVPGDVIWGATARVLTELLCIVTGVAWPEANRVWG
jgi:8-oxo-dGTP pyrophosphatase MutT (NUDIX family)